MYTKSTVWNRTKYLRRRYCWHLAALSLFGNLYGTENKSKQQILKFLPFYFWVSDVCTSQNDNVLLTSIYSHARKHDSSVRQWTAHALLHCIRKLACRYKQQSGCGIGLFIHFERFLWDKFCAFSNVRRNTVKVIYVYRISDKFSCREIYSLSLCFIPLQSARRLGEKQTRLKHFDPNTPMYCYNSHAWIFAATLKFLL